jgi:2-polyprenyl-3-methyl-5-hydroxy-6-metoxy-1,4-benzoquinol methylase
MKTVDDVRTFWNAGPCQSNLSQAEERLRYFQEISDKRYGIREWHVPTVAKFGSFQGKDVLEIGCGIATDGLEFAKNGANYVGVDLTPKLKLQMPRKNYHLPTTVLIISIASV